MAVAPSGICCPEGMGKASQKKTLFFADNCIEIGKQLCYNVLNYSKTIIMPS